MYTNTFTNQQITASILPRLQRNLCCEFINQTIPEILTLAFNIKSTATSCSCLKIREKKQNQRKSDALIFGYEIFFIITLHEEF